MRSSLRSRNSRKANSVRKCGSAAQFSSVAEGKTLLAEFHTNRTLESGPNVQNTKFQHASRPARPIEPLHLIFSAGFRDLSDKSQENGIEKGGG